MVVFELPKETETIQILDEAYEVDIQDFTILEEIKRMPSMANGLKPTDDEALRHYEAIQNMFKRIIGYELPIPKKTPEKMYFAVRFFMTKLYAFINAKQSEYLNTEYAVQKDTIRLYEAMAEVLKYQQKGSDSPASGGTEN